MIPKQTSLGLSFPPFGSQRHQFSVGGCQTKDCLELAIQSLPHVKVIQHSPTYLHRDAADWRNV